VAIRFTLAAALLLGIALPMGVKLGRQPREKTLWIVNALGSFTISYGVVYWAEQWVPSGLTAVLFATYPFFVMLLTRFMMPEERLSARELLGVLVGFAGVGVIFMEDLSALGGDNVAFASGVMLISPLAAAVGSVVVKRWGSHIHPFSISAVPMAMTGVVMGLLAVAVERERTFDWNPTSIGALLYLAIFGSALTFSLYYWLLTHISVRRLALITYVIPVVAVTIGMFRGEPMTSRILAGAGLVLAGVVLAVHRRRARSTPVGPPQEP
jgi:drug/metabolite transporter (DMT)-like permease